MKPLLKVMLILASIFAATFIIGRLTGFLTVENVKAWFDAIQNANPLLIASLAIALLFVDLFVAVPTLTITVLAGFFLGFPAGFVTAITGMSLAAFCGYGISRGFGEKPLTFLVSDQNERNDLMETFQRHGPMMIMLSRAAPIVPEVTACMAGVTRMAFIRYLLFFSLSTIPYVAIATYAGSISSVENPQPAILAVIFLYGVLWIGWYVFRRRSRLEHAENNAIGE